MADGGATADRKKGTTVPDSKPTLIMASALAQRLASSSRSAISKNAFKNASQTLSRPRQPCVAFSTARRVFQEGAAKPAGNTTPAPAPQPIAENISSSWDATASNPTSSDGATDWSRSYHGLSTEAFPAEVAEKLMAPVNPADVEITPGKPPQVFPSRLY